MKILYALTITAMAFASTAMAADGPESATQLSAFVDPQYSWENRQVPTEGFALFDAALYLTHTFASGEAKIDLPFNGSLANNFDVTSGKAQAYFEYRHDFGFKWKLGQWDTPFGVEVNDTADIALTRQGRIFSVFLPLTHLGVMTSYATEVIGVNLMAANPQNQGILNGQNPEFGAQVSIAALPNVKLTPGVLIHKQGDEYRMLYDLVLNTSYASSSIDLGIDLLDVPGASELGKGFILVGTQALSEELSFTTRVEYLLDHAVGTDSELQITGGPQFSIAKNLRLKADYTINSGSPVGGDEVLHQIAFAGVYRFN